MATTAEPADVEIDLHFSLKPGQFSAGRGLLAIATAGLSTVGSGLCSPTKIDLDALVVRSGTGQTRGYHFSESESTRADFDSQGCQVVDEHTQPKVFAGMVRELFDAIDMDRLIDQSPVAGPAPPLVLVQALRAEGLLRQAVLEASPFPHYAFGPISVDISPDYVLQVDLAVSGGRMREENAAQILRASFLQFKRMCEPTQFALHAHLFGPDGAER